MTDGPAVPALVVGFDLDMTLVDSRPGIRASFAALVADTGVELDVETIVGRLGPPLEVELANWVEDARVEGLAAQYRAHYRVLGVPGTTLLPGARAAVEAVHARGGQALVVTAKEERSARACLAHVALAIDVVVGLRFGDGKVAALREHGATVYVGDTVTDIESGLAAHARAVGVTTGPDSADALRAAGADAALDSLEAFPAWLAAFAR
jgi:phosphoglycolate phosphatase-like HAD superfamily hydrolase